VQETKDELLSEIYKKLMDTDPKNFPATTLEGLQRVCLMSFTFVAQMSRVQNIRDNIPCKVVDLPATTMRVNLAFAFAKGSPYREVINYK
jgi:ribosomal protein S1